MNLQQDPYGNYLARYVFPDPVTEFKIEVDLVADMTVYNPFDFFIEESAGDAGPSPIREDIAGRPDDLHAAASRLEPALQTISRGIDRTPISTIDFIVGAQCPARRSEIGYVIRMEPGVQTPEETLTLALGSCRDSELAAGRDPAPPRLRRPLRLRLSHPARRLT